MNEFDWGYGHCPECAGWFKVRKNGTMRVHQGRRGTVHELRRCPGSGERPGLTAAEVSR